MRKKMMIRREKKKTEGQSLSDGLIRLYSRYFDRSHSSLWNTAVHIFGEHVGRQSAVRYRMCHQLRTRNQRAKCGYGNTIHSILN